MKNIFLLIIIIQSLAACNNDANKPIEKENTPETITKKLSVEEQAKGHIMRALSIPANEKFLSFINYSSNVRCL